MGHSRARRQRHGRGHGRLRSGWPPGPIRHQRRFLQFAFSQPGRQVRRGCFRDRSGASEDGSFISGMGLDFRDFNNDGYPDIVFVALNNQTFPLFQNTGKGDFREVTSRAACGTRAVQMSGFGAGLYDFDNDGWKDLFVTRGHVESISMPSQPVDQFNTVFRNPGSSGKWVPLTEEAGLRRRPCRAPSGLRLRRSGWRWAHRRSRHGSRPGGRDLDEPQREVRPLARHCTAGHEKQPRRYRRALSSS